MDKNKKEIEETEEVKEIEEAEETKYRTFAGTRNYYYDTHDKEGNITKNITVEEWENEVYNDFKKVIKKRIQSFVFLATISHKRDKKENKNITPHIHFVFKFNNTQSYKQMKKELKISRKKNLSYNVDIGYRLRYLTHTTLDSMLEKKTRYDIDDISVWSAENEANENEANENKAKKIKQLKKDELINWYTEKISLNIKEEVKQLLENTIKININTKKEDKHILEQTLLKTSKDICNETEIKNMLKKHFDTEEEAYNFYIRHIQKYKDAINDGIIERTRKEKIEGREEKKLIYIHGVSGIGKTRLALILAKELNAKDGRDKASFYIVPTTKNKKNWDWISSYRNEYTTIFDDIPSDTFLYDEFLQTFNTHISTEISSRYKNKMWFSKYAIITKSEPIKKYIKNICKTKLSEYQINTIFENESSKNKESQSNILFQVQRRFKMIIKINEKNIKITKLVKNEEGNIEEKQIKIFSFDNIKDIWSEENEILKNIIEEIYNILNK